VFDLLLGEEQLQIDGTLKRKEEEGMAYKMDVVYEQAQNGGLKVRLMRRDRVLLWGAAIGATGAVTAALIGG
jgi:ketosteroid isomerase-like protein